MGEARGMLSIWRKSWEFNWSLPQLFSGFSKIGELMPKPNCLEVEELANEGSGEVHLNVGLR
jgi:hypothetical protein